MAVFPKDIKVSDFFKNEVPKVFKEGLGKVNTASLQGTEFSLQFNIPGAGGGTYCLKVKDGKDLQIIEGGIDKPVIMIELAEKDFRDSISGEVLGTMYIFMSQEQVANRQKLDAVKGVSGTLNLELTKPDGGVFKIKMVFNGASQPQANLKMILDDYVKMTKKEVDGQSLFMSGKMGFEGDMMFLIQLQGVMA